MSQCVVVPCEIGGGFGGKIAVYLEPVAALLSRKCGRPVKMVMQRNEVFEATGPTPGSFLRVKLGARKDGTLVAGEAWMAYDCGAFPGGVIGPGCMCVFSCYELAARRVDGFDVCNNKPKTQAYRAPGSTQAAFACEQVIDELAATLGIDPIEFRLKNAAREGTRRVDGPVYPRVGLVECLRGGPEQRSLEVAPAGQEPRPGHRRRLLVQHRWRLELLGQRQRRRHRDARRRLDRHRRHAHQHRHAAGRDAGHRRRGHPAPGRRHRLGRLHLPDRRQPRHLRHRTGGVQARSGPPGPDETAGRHDLGMRPGRGRGGRRRLSPERPVAHVQATGREDLGARSRSGGRARPRSPRRARRTPSACTSPMSRSTRRPAR